MTTRQAEATVRSGRFGFRIVQLHDGRLASCSTDGIELWNLPASEFHKFSGIKSMVPLSDKALLIGLWNGSITAWNPSSGEAEATFERHTGAVTGLALPPDGELLSSSPGHTIVVGAIASSVGGEAIATFVADAAIVSSCIAVAAQQTVIAGDVSVRLHFLRLERD